MKRILVINVNWLGDVIFSTPFIRTLRDAYPRAYIACIVLPRCREILQSNPRLDEVIEYDEKGSHWSLPGKLRFIRDVRRRRFDTAFVLHPSWKRALISVIAGIPRRIGYATKNRQRILTTAVAVPEQPLHKIDYFLALAAACGMTASLRTYEFFYSPDDEARGRQLLHTHGVMPEAGYIVLNPGGNWEPKRWPAGHFKRLATMIRNVSAIPLVVVGARNDVLLAEEIAAGMPSPPVVLAGQTRLGELGAIMKHSRAVVSADSGPMHIAAAVGANTIALFGPTDPALTGPRGPGTSTVIKQSHDCPVPCYRQDCTDYHCMQAIRPEDVWQALAPFVGRDRTADQPDRVRRAT